MRPSGSPQELERRRLRALALLGDGLLPVEVARRVGVDRRSVRRWKAAARRRGEAGVHARPAPGRPSKLTTKDKRRLQALLLKGAQAAGFDTDLWTCPRVAEVIAQRLDVHYHVDHVGRLLHDLGWTPQQPTCRAVERDETAIRRWVHEQWPRVKKRLPPARGDRLHRRSGIPDGATGAPHLGSPRADAEAGAAGPLATQGVGDRRLGYLAPPRPRARLLRCAAGRQFRRAQHLGLS